jgi:hypothetical protein
MQVESGHLNAKSALRFGRQVSALARVQIFYLLQSKDTPGGFGVSNRRSAYFCKSITSPQPTRFYAVGFFYFVGKR